MVEDPLQQQEIGGDAEDDISAQGVRRPAESKAACLPGCDHLGEQRIVVHRNRAPLSHSRVYSQPMPGWFTVERDGAGLR